MNRLELAEDDTLALMRSCIDQWHEWINGTNDLVIKLLMAYGPRDKHSALSGPALKHHGQAALGKIRLARPEETLLGGYRVVVLLDGDKWPDLPPDTRLAVLDHELCHLSHNETGKLKLVPDDYAITGMYDVIERHKKASGEIVSLIGIIDHGSIGQLLLPFMAKKPTKPKRQAKKTKQEAEAA